MAVIPNRARRLKSYIESHPTSKVKDRIIPVQVGGEYLSLPVYRVEIKPELLVYNIRNGRFRAELLEKEAELGRKLDPNEQGDSKIIQQLLLDQDPTETNALKDNLGKFGQVDPGLITFDGEVINANRRMAILSSLFKETRDRRFQFLMVGILPEGVQEVDLWRIEAGLQFAKDFLLKYGGVNELLKLQEGIDQGLENSDIAAALQGRYSEAQIKEKLDILRLVESYLETIGYSKEYHRVQDQGQLEKFISLNASMKGLKKQDRKAEMAEVIAVAFQLIEKTDVRHLDIRKIRKIVDHKEAFAELMSSFRGIHKPSKARLEESFNTAIDIVEAAEDSNKPMKLLKKALASLSSINEKNIQFKDPEAKDLLKKISSRIVILEKLLKAGR